YPLLHGKTRFLQKRSPGSSSRKSQSRFLCTSGPVPTLLLVALSRRPQRRSRRQTDVNKIPRPPRELAATVLLVALTGGVGCAGVKADQSASAGGQRGRDSGSGETGRGGSG